MTKQRKHFPHYECAVDNNKKHKEAKVSVPPSMHKGHPKPPTSPMVSMASEEKRRGEKRRGGKRERKGDSIRG